MKTAIWTLSIVVVLLVVALVTLGEQFQYEQQVNDAAINEINQIQTPIMDCGGQHQLTESLMTAHADTVLVGAQ